MPFSALAGAAINYFVGGGSSAQTAQGPSTQPGTAAAAADPFASQRGQYQTQLQQLMTGQNFQTDPSYQFAFTQGQQALDRSAAAQGDWGSGAQAAALVNYGQGMASQQYQNQFARLAQLSGANTGQPGTAGQIMQYGANQRMQNQSQLANTIVGAGQQAYNSWNSSNTSGGNYSMLYV